MPNVFFHFKEAGQTEPDNEVLEVVEVPRVGEFVTRHTTSPWYRIAIVVHTPFEGKELAAEVFAIKVDQMEALEEW